ncbi:AraC family transcriptional regulator [Bacillus sp. FJAT-49711]|uniref:helix-turn-helix domain-containing protein n=1 Tax=Bacillus sp. FJAT-49711 TaxID=2833585 RepID=UPI001BC8CC59|nr:helix-turn-helix domain-containing protein [Bacillus sp. FJAT-49711]MBS4217473.1 AraC family transcriptional regulator [Bacillus sp. FJAT-49711]
MRELNNIGALVSIDWKLTPYRVSRNETLPEATAELEKYKQNSAIIEDLYLYYFQQDTIYYGKGQMSMEAFLKFKANQKTISKESFVSNLKNIDYAGISTDIKPFGSNPTYVYPLPPGSAGTYGIVFMKLENSFFENMINNILGSYEGNVFIYDQNNQPVSTFSNNSTNFNTSIIKKILKNDSRIQDMNIDNVNYSIVKVKSTVSNWSYVMAMPTNQFFSKVSKFKTFMLLVVLFIAIVASGITIYTALKNFHPIQKMIDIIKRKETSIEFKSKNDLDNLSVLIENLYIKHDDLNNKYIRQKPLIRDQYLTTLLKGQMKTINKSDELFESIQLGLDGSHSFVMVTALSKNQLSRLDMEELEAAAGKLLNSANIYGVELINDKIIAYIINGKLNSKAEKNQFLTQFRQLLTDDSSMFIGVGKTYSGKNFINRSFIEASAAFEYGKTNHIHDIVHFDEIKEQQETDTIWLPKSHILKLTQSCKQGNLEIAEEAIHSLIIWLQNNEAPNHLLKHLKYDIVNTLMKIASETGISLNPSTIYYQYDEANLQQFQKILSELTKEICIKISEKKEAQNNQLQLDILEYINTHFQDYNLSLENIAKDFNLSASYLSRFIKEETTKTFSQYVWELRLGEVKRQLIETDLPIKNIISSVGYIDAPNFTRKFKKTLGLTPTEYRNIHAKGWGNDPEKSF